MSHNSPLASRDLISGSWFRQAVCVQQNEVVITQGDTDGLYFYVVQSGAYDVLIKSNGKVPVHKYHPGGKWARCSFFANAHDE